MAIEGKGAGPELLALIHSRLGLALAEDSSLGKARDLASRYLLVAEFCDDLAGPPPDALSTLPQPANKDELKRCREVAGLLRKDHPQAYTDIADAAEKALGLASAGLDPAGLGSVDTFRFEEKALLAHAGALTAGSQYDEALAIAEERRRNFWTDRDVGRQAQWIACSLMAELGREVARIQPQVARMPAGPRDWVERYAAADGWHLADAFQRRLETWVAQMDEDPKCEAALHAVRGRYEELLRLMTEGFMAALASSGWHVEGVLAQTRIHSELIAPSRARTAYVLVDALRYEMGIELSQRLGDVQELTVVPAVAALPTLTPVGMGALMPGASASFSVVESGGKLGVSIGATTLTNLQSRQKLLRAEHPQAVGVTLDQVLKDSPAKLAEQIGGAPLVVVRSSEIDVTGESGTESYSRWVMGIVLDQIARGVRKLTAAGMERFVIVADHGHLFSQRREDDMKIGSPGGETVDIHRRCWIGRGGATSPATVRVTGAELGYATDLDFIFPRGPGIFVSGGDACYHHGGASLQGLLVPVVTFRVAATRPEPAHGAEVSLEVGLDAVTNRMFSVTISVAAELFSEDEVALRVLLMDGPQEVGRAGMAVGAEYEPATGILRAKAGLKTTVGLMLVNDQCRELRVVVQDAGTDAVLARSEKLPVRLGV